MHSQLVKEQTGNPCLLNTYCRSFADNSYMSHLINPHKKPRRTPLSRHVNKFRVRPGLPQYHTAHETSKIWSQFLGPQKLSSYPCVVLPLKPQSLQSQIHHGGGRWVVMGSSSSPWWALNPMPWPLPANTSFPFPSKLYLPPMSWDCDCPSPQERYPSTRAQPRDGQHPQSTEGRAQWAKPHQAGGQGGRASAPCSGTPWGCWGAHSSHPW